MAKKRRTILTGTVHCRRGILNSVTMQNDVGGTAALPVGDYRVRLLTSWYDYETGVRCIGQLLNLEDIKTVCAVGTSGFMPEDYRTYSDQLFQNTLHAARDFDPGRVYFSEDDFTPDSAPD